jgi:hypothetical protein
MTDDIRAALRDALRAAGINPYDRANIPDALTPVVRGLIADHLDAAAAQLDLSIPSPGFAAAVLRDRAAALRATTDPEPTP